LDQSSADLTQGAIVVLEDGRHRVRNSIRCSSDFLPSIFSPLPQPACGRRIAGTICRWRSDGIGDRIKKR
jgi:hypothetical protein